jgi:putative restriction endonuclease
MTRRLWTREELILALNLYLKIDFGKMHSRNPDVIHLASIIEREPNAVAMRLVNYASVDPFHQNRGVKGLDGGKRQVQPIWDEFVMNREQVVYESEQILAQKEQKPLEVKFPELKELKDWAGETKIREVKARINQQVFRQMVLANYQGSCAITGINIPKLLVASHIIPWAVNEKERLNPENGICLSPLYDRAFDQGLIGITPDLTVHVSEKLKGYSKEPFHQNYFASINGSKLRDAQKYKPRREFLEWHLLKIFQVESLK